MDYTHQCYRDGLLDLFGIQSVRLGNSLVSVHVRRSSRCLSVGGAREEEIKVRGEVEVVLGRGLAWHVPENRKNLRGIGSDGCRRPLALAG